MLWMVRQSYRMKPMEDQVELDQCRWSTLLYLSSMLAAAGHIACCVRPSREVQIPNNSAFPNMKIKESLKMRVFL